MKMIDWNQTARRIANALEQSMLGVYNGQRHMCGLPALTLDEYRNMRLAELRLLNQQVEDLLEMIKNITPDEDVMQCYVDYLYRKD